MKGIEFARLVVANQKLQIVEFCHKIAIFDAFPLHTRLPRVSLSVGGA